MPRFNRRAGKNKRLHQRRFTPDACRRCFSHARNLEKGRLFMIYPTNTGKSGEHLRLTTLESVWIQGKLRMWGRWSYIGGGKTGNMFNQLLTSKKLTKTAINEALRRIRESGIDKPELEAFLREMIAGRQKSWLSHCTDAEALRIDGVISKALASYPGLIDILRQRY